MGINRRRTNARPLASIFNKRPGGEDAEIFKAIVLDVILDEEHQLVKERKVGSGKIGNIKFIPMTQGFLEGKDSDYFAAPLDKNIMTLPVKNEKVDIFKSTTGYFYRRSNDNLTPNVDNSENAIERFFSGLKNTGDDSKTGDDYSSTANTGIANKSDVGSGEDKGYGDTFESDKATSIHKLKLYEGDTLLESRFGQSIRLSGYNNASGKLSPTITIRNRENNLSQTNTEFANTTLEDINRDGSTLILSAGERKLEFQPGVVDDGGSTNFKQKPSSFQKYPSELKGDQILINSGRVIISAKESEMIFYSKGNYGFISDAALSIDNKEGMLVSVGDDIFFTTNDSDFRITSGTGEIHLGNGAGEEKLAKGETLVDLLSELIDAINQMTHPTPAGPSGPPVNAATFANIKTRLKTILSSQNFTV
jgi:hypothetical protein